MREQGQHHEAKLTTLHALSEKLAELDAQGRDHEEKLTTLDALAQEGEKWGRPRTFTAAPPVGKGPTTFLMYADMGTDQYNDLEHFGNVDNAKGLMKVAQRELAGRQRVRPGPHES